MADIVSSRIESTAVDFQNFDLDIITLDNNILTSFIKCDSGNTLVDLKKSTKLSTLSAATTDTDNFIVSDSGILKSRTGLQVLSDIGAISAVSGVSGRTSATLSGNIATIDLVTTGTSGTYIKVITDNYGRVTSGQANLTSADIPTHNQSWLTISGTPTTLDGYGITDAISAVSGTLGRITASKSGYGVTLDLDTIGTSGTYIKVVTDNYGRVTSGGSLVASDIPAHTHSKLVASDGSPDPALSVDENGYIIIGNPTTSAYKLNIDGGIYTDSTVYAANSMRIGINTEITEGNIAFKETTIKTNANNSLIFQTNDDNDRITITSAGNVSINILSAGGFVKATAGTGVLVIATSSDIPNHIQDWSTISGTPTTLSGYGITDAASATHYHYSLMASDGDPNPALSVNATGLVGIGCTPSGTMLDIHTGSAAWPNHPAGIYLRGSNITHGRTSIYPTDVYGAFDVGNIFYQNNGGLRITGLSDTSNLGYSPGLTLVGIFGESDPTDTTPAISLIGQKSDGGTGVTALGDGETVFRVRNNNTDLLVLMGDGKTGIGTAGPQVKLDVAGSVIVGTHNGSNQLYIERFSNSYPYAHIVGGYADNNVGVGIRLDPRDATGAEFTAISIESDGKVGIGTTSPDCKLHVYSESAGSVSASIFTQLAIENNDYAAISILTPNNKYGFIFFGDPEDNTIGQIYYQHTDNSMRFVTNHVDAVIINTSGNVGIGSTPSINTMLDIYTGSANSPNHPAGIYLRDSDVAHGRTDVYPTDVFGAFDVSETGYPDNGGLRITGISDASYSPGLTLVGIFGETNPEVIKPVISLIGQKSDGGTGITYLSATETLLQVKNFTEAMLTIKGNGNVGIGTTTFDTLAEIVLAIRNGTAPSAHVDNTIQIYSVDSSDNTSTLGLMLEQAVEVIGTFTASHKIKVKINGTEYWIELDEV